MGQNVGMDFGTTYSVIADAEKNADGRIIPQAVALFSENDNTVYNHTLVARSTSSNKMFFANAARLYIGINNYVAYRGFKLLLAEEKNSGLLVDAGYDEDITPEGITEKYINHLFDHYKVKKGLNEIYNLVVCIPDIWERGDEEERYQNDTFGIKKYTACKKLLEDIIDRLGIAKNTEFLSEPEAASIYYAYPYRKNAVDENYEGHLLLIDYGGGTLDITLCRIGRESGQTTVKVIHSEGAGENTEGFIGKAGLAFMTEVVHLALIENGKNQSQYEEYKKQGAIDKAVVELDQLMQILGGKSDYELDSERQSYKSDFKNLDRKSLDFVIKRNNRILFEDFFLWTSDGPVTCSISYKHIAQAYLNVVFPVLERHLDGRKEGNDQVGMLNWIEKNKEIREDLKGIDPLDQESGRFKIQLIGGFCNFYLVEQQIYRILGLKAVGNDKRFTNSLGISERTLAVAYGAVLKANGCVDVIKKWPSAIGIKVYLGTDVCMLWAMNPGDDLEENKIYLIKDPERGAAIINASSIEFLQFKDDKNNNREMKFDLKLRGKSSDNYVLGFSCDRYRVVTMHWWRLSDLADMNTIHLRCGNFEKEINGGARYGYGTLSDFDPKGYDRKVLADCL